MNKHGISAPSIISVEFGVTVWPRAAQGGIIIILGSVHTTRAVNTGVISDTRVRGPSSRVD